MKNTFTIREALSYAWKRLSEHFWFLVLSTLAFVAISALLDKTGHAGPAIAVARLIGLVVSYFASFTFIRIGLMIHKGKKPSWRDILDFEADSLGWYILGSLFFALCYILGLALLIVPGIIVLVRGGFFAFFLIEKGSSPIAALKESFALTKGEFWHIFGFSMVMALINIAGALAFGVGLLVTAPLCLLATVYVYEALKAKAHAAA